ncbi:MAG: endonuclease/exonuclease/phosphatase family protein [Armatimonadota bacterium]
MASASAVREGGARAAARRLLSGRRLLRTLRYLAAVLYLGALAALCLADRSGPERFWWSTANLYAPQWLWALPAAALLLTLLRRSRRAWLALLPLLWVLGPAMGFHWSLRSGSTGAPGCLRLVTYNIATKWDSPAVDRELRRLAPDLVCLQESGAPPQLPPLLRSGWHLAGISGCIVASRYPLAEISVRSLRGGPEWRRYVRCRVLAPRGAVTLYNLHLDTPRDSLAAVLRRGPAALPQLQEEAGARVFRAAAIAEELRAERGPVLIAGDFNAPARSLVHRTLRGAGFRDAFAERGRGYGYTYGHATRLGHSFVRIDHILVSPALEVERCWTGSPDGSDHRAVVADLRLPGSSE